MKRKIRWAMAFIILLSGIFFFFQLLFHETSGIEKETTPAENQAGQARKEAIAPQPAEVAEVP